MIPSERDQQSPTLQVLRGFAAIGVLYSHAVAGASAFFGPVPETVIQVAHITNYRVDFFFVLSGFILMQRYLVRSDRRQGALNFLSSRVLRIFPPYLPLSVIMLLVYSLLPQLSESGGREVGLVSSLLLLPDGLPPALSVAWTLVHEMMFYIVFSLIYLSPVLWIAAMLVWAVAILSLPLTGVMLHPALLTVMSPYNLDFFFGVAAAVVMNRPGEPSRLTSKAVRGIAALTTAVGLIAALVMLPNEALRLVISVGLTLLIVGSLRLEDRFPLNWPAPLLFLGGISYSLFLVHYPILSVSQRVARHFDLDWIPGLFLGLVCSLAGAVLYYRYVEYPLRMRVRCIRQLPSLVQPTRRSVS